MRLIALRGVNREAEAARAAGKTRYFTGRPCERGHFSERRADSGACIECGIERNRARYAGNREALRAEAKARMARLYRIDPERFRARSNANYAADPGVFRNRARDYRKANPEKLRISDHLKKRRRKAAPGKFTRADIVAKFSAQAGVCVCGADLTLGYHIDHITPISLGGSNWPDNIQLLCPPCNCSKSGSTMEEWAARRRA